MHQYGRVLKDKCWLLATCLLGIFGCHPSEKLCESSVRLTTYGMPLYTNRNLFYEESGAVIDIGLGRIDPYERASIECVLGGLLYHARRVAPKELDLQFNIVVRDRSLCSRPVATKLNSSELISIYTNKNDSRRNGQYSFDFSHERMLSAVKLIAEGDGLSVSPRASSNKLVVTICSPELGGMGGAKRRAFRVAVSDRPFFEQLALPTNLPSGGLFVCAYDPTNGVFVSIDYSKSCWPVIGKRYLNCIGEEGDE